jgi:hypothetical protein
MMMKAIGGRLRILVCYFCNDLIANVMVSVGGRTLGRHKFWEDPDFLPFQ